MFHIHYVNEDEEYEIELEIEEDTPVGQELVAVLNLSIDTGSNDYDPPEED